MWVEYQGKHPMFFRKNPETRLCWSMIGYVRFKGQKVEGFSRKTDTGCEFLPLPAPV